MHNMNVMKVDFDSDEAVSLTYLSNEYPVTESKEEDFPVLLKLPAVMNEAKHITNLTNLEPDSDDDTQISSVIGYLPFDTKHGNVPESSVFPVMKNEDSLKVSWEIYSMNEQLKDDISVDDNEFTVDITKSYLERDTCDDTSTSAENVINEVYVQQDCESGVKADFSKQDTVNDVGPQHDQEKENTRAPTGEKAFKCGICSKGFTRRYNLAVHTRLHSGFKPFKCGLCSKTYTRHSSLVLHTRTHSEDMPYECEMPLEG